MLSHVYLVQTHTKTITHGMQSQYVHMVTVLRVIEDICYLRWKDIKHEWTNIVAICDLSQRKTLILSGWSFIAQNFSVVSLCCFSKLFKSMTRKLL